MSNLNILISTRNESDYVKLCIQSIRMFADVDTLSVILIDNNSSDGLAEWALEQTDITYIQNDDHTMPYGQIINQVYSMLNLQGNLLLLDPHFLLTPACLSRMIQTLYTDDNIGVVGPLSNGMYKYQQFDAVNDYEKAIGWSGHNTSISDKRVMALSHEAILIKGSLFSSLNGFDDNIQIPLYTIRDFCFRMITHNFILKICQSALLWDSRNTLQPLYSNKHDEMLLESKWGMHYFNSTANEMLINMIEHHSNEVINVLEIGCDCGGTLLEIKNLFPNANVYGSEINECAANIASHFATVTVNNIEEYNLPYSSSMFDYIILGDVLEHLHKPEQAIEYCKSLLKDNGSIIASIPNLMHISVIEDLLRGNFTYCETGLLDKTHIHFFTYNEIIKVFQNCGYKVEKIVPIILKISESQYDLIEKLAAIHNTPCFMFETFQYVIYASKI